MKIYTAHDAVSLLKADGFFKYLKYYDVTFLVYHINDSEKDGQYYIVITKQEQFIDLVYLVDLMKRTLTEKPVYDTLDVIREKSYVKYEITVNRKRGSNNEYQ